MEDYSGAYSARKNDVFELSRLQTDHTIAIFHLGGIAVECRLKSLLFFYHGISEWKHKSLRKKDSMFDQVIINPKHDLTKAIERMPDLYSKAITDAQFIKHLKNVIFPLGSVNPDYINLRYIPHTIQSKEHWQQSFDYVCGWLEKNEKTIR
ncbi:hypothetical protein [Crenothrix polyspora]|uniref:Uncharacterized protein n=1 Tax=Crenothrix polyspora TaxID=360316 RepID=A0A1R4HDH3_9GAMM|nr:hypothetical protein [Crenothrix polyspora]SJM94295.1 conserved hypothetical protein [Crenothrix polyspora]